MAIFTLNFSDALFSFVSLILEGMPFLIIGSLVSGIVAAFVPSEWITRIVPKKALPAVLLSGLLGSFIPMCECGVIPVVRRLIAKGMPIGSAITFLLAAPIVNVLVGLTTYIAFRGQGPLQMTLLRIGIGYGIAVIAGLIIWRIAKEKVLNHGLITEQKRSNNINPTSKPLHEKISTMMHTALVDFMIVGSAFIIGIGIVSIFSTGLHQSVLTIFGEHGFISIAGFMTLSFILSLCSTSDSFVAATFTQFAPEAKLAFLLIGPMVDVKLLFFYRTIFKAHFLLGLTICLLIAVFIVSVVVGEFI